MKNIQLGRRSSSRNLRTTLKLRDDIGVLLNEVDSVSKHSRRIPVTKSFILLQDGIVAQASEDTAGLPSKPNIDFLVFCTMSQEDRYPPWDFAGIAVDVQ